MVGAGMVDIPARRFRMGSMGYDPETASLMRIAGVQSPCNQRVLLSAISYLLLLKADGLHTRGNLFADGSI